MAAHAKDFEGRNQTMTKTDTNTTDIAEAPKKRGRPATGRKEKYTYLDKQLQTRLSPQQVERLMNHLEQTGEKSASYIRRAVLEKLERDGA